MALYNSRNVTKRIPTNTFSHMLIFTSYLYWSLTLTNWKFCTYDYLSTYLNRSNTNYISLSISMATTFFPSLCIVSWRLHLTKWKVNIKKHHRHLQLYRADTPDIDSYWSFLIPQKSDQHISSMESIRALQTFLKHRYGHIHRHISLF